MAQRKKKYPTNRSNIRVDYVDFKNQK